MATSAGKLRNEKGRHLEKTDFVDFANRVQIRQETQTYQTINLSQDSSAWAPFGDSVIAGVIQLHKVAGPP